MEARSGAAVLTMGSLIGVCLGSFGLVAGGEVIGAVAVLAASLPLVLLQDLARFGLVARARPERAIVADACWLVPPLALIATDLARGSTSEPLIGALVWFGGLLLSLLWLSRGGHLRPPVYEGLAEWLRADPRRWHLAADAAMAGLAPVGNGLGAAAVAGADATASVRGAAAMYAPLATMGLTVSLGAVPEAKRRGPGGALHLLLGVTGLLVVVSAVWAGLLLNLPTQVGELILGATWQSAEPIVPYVAVEYVGLAMWTGATAMLRFTNSTRTALRIRSVYAPAALVLPVVALVASDDARAFAATLAILGFGVGAFGLAIGVRRMRAAALGAS